MISRGGWHYHPPLETDFQGRVTLPPAPRNWLTGAGESTTHPYKMINRGVNLPPAPRNCRPYKLDRSGDLCTEAILDLAIAVCPPPRACHRRHLAPGARASAATSRLLHRPLTYFTFFFRSFHFNANICIYLPYLFFSFIPFHIISDLVI